MIEFLTESERRGTIPETLEEIPYKKYAAFIAPYRSYIDAAEKLSKLSEGETSSPKFEALESKLRLLRNQCLIALITPEPVAVLQETSEQDAQKLFGLAVSAVSSFESVERLIEPGETQRLAIAEQRREITEFEKDVLLLESIIGVRNVTAGALKTFRAKMKTAEAKEALKKSGGNMVLLKGKIPVLREKLKTKKRKTPRLVSNRFSYKGEQYEIPAATMKEIVSQNLFHYSNIQNPNLKVWQYCQIMEFRKSAGPSYENAIKTDNFKELSAVLYNDSLRQVATLCCRVLPGQRENFWNLNPAPEKLERFPVEEKEIESFIEKRMKHFENVPASVVLDIVFFLVSFYDVYKKTQSLNTFGRAINPGPPLRQQGETQKKRRGVNRLLQKAAALLKG